jgi:hypothetical protein
VSEEANDHSRAGEQGASTSVSEDRVAVVRRWTEAFNRLEVDSVLHELDEQVELHEWPAAPGARAYRGHDGDSAGDRAKGRGSSVEVDLRSFNVYTFRDRSVIRIQLFTERDEALAAAGLPANFEEERQ